MNTLIRDAKPEDVPALHELLMAAFGDDGEEIVGLVDALLNDPTAEPRLSRVAIDDTEQLIGHVLFTRVQLNPAAAVQASILAPLAVHPDHQRQGLGGQLITNGLEHLRTAGTDLVFVLGHPGYYPRHGFHPAGARGFEAPHPIKPEHADAWMVQELRPGVIDQASGTVACAHSLNEKKYWVEA